MTSDPLSS